MAWLRNRNQINSNNGNVCSCMSHFTVLSKVEKDNTDSDKSTTPMRRLAYESSRQKDVLSTVVSLVSVSV